MQTKNTTVFLLSLKRNNSHNLIAIAKTFSPVCLLLVQLASINHFYSMRQQEDNVSCKSLSLPWGYFQPPCSWTVWNKRFKISPYFNFYLHYTNTKVKVQCKYIIANTMQMKLIYHTKDIASLTILIQFSWLHLFFDSSHFSLQNFFINNYHKWRIFKIIKTSLEACFFLHDLIFYNKFSANKITEQMLYIIIITQML